MSGFWLLLNASLAVMPGLLATQMGVRGVSLTFALVIAYIVLAVVYVMGGAISQRIGRRAYLMAASAVSAVFGTLFYYLLLNTLPGNTPMITLLTTINTGFAVAHVALTQFTIS